MDYTVQTSADGKTFILNGRLTFKDHSEITNLKTDLGDLARSQKCVFDMQGLEFIDSSGLGSLISIGEAVAPNEIEIILHRPQPKVLGIIKACGFDNLFRIEE